MVLTALRRASGSVAGVTGALLLQDQTVSQLDFEHGDFTVLWLVALASVLVFAASYAIPAAAHFAADRPRLKADPAESLLAIDILDVPHDPAKAYPVGQLTTIPFFNDARGGKPAHIAREVSALIEIFDSKGRVIDRSHGRWQELGWRSSGFDEPPPGKLTIAPDSARHRLDVLVRVYLVYPSSDPPTLNTYEKMQLVKEPRRMLYPVRTWTAFGAGTYRMTVTLSGENFRRQTFKYKVEVEDYEYVEGEDMKGFTPELKPA